MPTGFFGAPADADPDHYGALGVPASATPAELRAAYRRRVVETHPDKAGGDGSEFRRVQAAYEALSDPELRRAHDLRRQRDKAAPPRGFSAFAGAARGFAGAGSAPADCFDITLPLMAIINGTHQRVTASMPLQCARCAGSGAASRLRTRCAACGGSGTAWRSVGGIFSIALGRCAACAGRGLAVKPGDACAGCEGSGAARAAADFDITVPPGAPDGHVLVIPGAGSFDPAAGTRRDVRVTVHWSLPEGVRVHGLDVHTTLAVELHEVVHGARREVAALTPPAVVEWTGYRRPDRPFIVKGRGIAGGDLVVALDVRWPDDLTPPAAAPAPQAPPAECPSTRADPGQGTRAPDQGASPPPAPPPA